MKGGNKPCRYLGQMEKSGGRGMLGMFQKQCAGVDKEKNDVIVI